LRKKKAGLGKGKGELYRRGKPTGYIVKKGRDVGYNKGVQEIGDLPNREGKVKGENKSEREGR